MNLIEALVTWLEYGRTSGYIAARMPRQTEEEWADAVKSLMEDNRRLTIENDSLRGIATKVMPCHYCGVDAIAKCPYGFPGCALADDVVAFDESLNVQMREARDRVVMTCFCGHEMKAVMVGVTDDLWMCSNEACEQFGTQVNLDWKNVYVKKVDHVP